MCIVHYFVTQKFLAHRKRIYSIRNFYYGNLKTKKISNDVLIKSKSVKDPHFYHCTKNEQKILLLRGFEFWNLFFCIKRKRKVQTHDGFVWSEFFCSLFSVILFRLPLWKECLIYIWWSANLNSDVQRIFLHFNI